MLNLFRMDLYRMIRAKSFLIVLALSALLSLCSTPAKWALFQLARLIGGIDEGFGGTAQLSSILSNPYPFAFLPMIAASLFFYADLEFGYVKNIAGQVPKKGYTVLSKFCASMVLSAAFALTAIAFNLIGTLIFRSISASSEVGQSLLALLMKLILMQACLSIVLFFVAGLKNKSLGLVLSVLMGSGLMALVYLGIDAGIIRLFGLKSAFSISNYMPDQLLGETYPDTLNAILVSAAVTAIFLPLSIWIFDKKDVK